jgi:hypothetical protein
LEKVIARGDSRDVTTFSSGLRALRVWTVDHGPIERFAGVDLVFLNQDYNSLLLIQYKCMEKDSHSDQWNYHPNAQFHKEMERMRKVGLLIGKRTPAEAKLLDIRLDLGALYFKFCKRLPLSQQDGELADGMIVSLATTRMFLETSEKGLPRSRAIGYETCPRYLSNSLFSALARDGWIGSRGLSHQQYQEILGFVHERDETSLVLAEAGTMLPRS